MATSLDSPSRIIAFLDMDEFEVQLYQNKNYLQYCGTPCVVANRTGRIVAVSYEAKINFGITRRIRTREARERCDYLNIIKKPNRYGKPDAKTLRLGSWAVFDTLLYYCSLGRNVVIEYVPSDGFYIDCTEEINARANTYDYVYISENVFIEGSNFGIGKIFKDMVSPGIFKLMCGAVYVSELSDHLFEETRIECSAGIANNKLVAKMACLLNKPSGITIIPLSGFYNVTTRIDMSKITGFGKEKGKFVKGKLGIENLRQLRKWSLRQLEQVIGCPNSALKLYQGARGVCKEPVLWKGPSKSVSCSKSFHGPKRIMDIQTLLRNLRNRADEMEERFREEMSRHLRTATSLQIEIEFIGNYGLRKKRDTFQILRVPNGITHIGIPKQALQIIKNFAGISFHPFAEITKITLSASKWRGLEEHDFVCMLNHVGLGSQANTEPNESDSASLPSTTGSLGTTATQTNSTATNESNESVLKENKEDSLTIKVYQLRISLDRTEPNIWLVVQVPEDFTFYELHETIKDAFGLLWFGHYEFCTGVTTERGEPVVVGIPIPIQYVDGIKCICPEKETQMKKFLGNVGDNVIYLHEHAYEVEWPYTVTVEEILPAVKGRIYPYFIDGRGVPPNSKIRKQ